MPKIEVAIEIGTYRGGTLRFWRELLHPDGILISVDLNDRGYMNEVIRYFKDDSRVKFVIGNSVERVSEVRQLLPKPADFVFIDGCHDSEVVKSDIVSYGAMLKDNGVLILHDIINPNIKPLWEKLKGKHEMGMQGCTGIIEIHGGISHGIGVYWSESGRITEDVKAL